MIDPEISSAVLGQEKRRCNALVSRDFGALEAIISPELVHIHTTGQEERYAEYFETIRERLEFLSVSRGDLTLRHFGEAAVLTGLLIQNLRLRATGQEMVLRAIATQVWVNSEGFWRQVSFHASSLLPV